jgi:glyoxylase-like metal-dependent hydrolase (beta-lactamase superfamily II)
LEVIPFTFGPFEENPYLLIGPSGSRAILVDPGLDSEPILNVIRERGLAVEMIVNTHGHLDHVAGNAFFAEQTGAPLAIHALDRPFLLHLRAQGKAYGLDVRESPEPRIELQEGVALTLDGIEVEVIHTPGHSPGSVCLRFGARMLVGDTLFCGSVGRTDLPGGSWPELVRSIREKLFRLPGETLCYPGHGPETTLARERRDNPFVSDAALAAAPVERS